MDFFATAPKGLERALADELRSLGLTSAESTRGGVRLSGSLEVGYRACLGSRLANRVLLSLASFPAPDPEALYQGVRSINWSEHLRAEQTLAVDFASSHSQITHTHFGALKVKDAVVDQFRDKTGQRPNVSTEHPDVQINAHVHDDLATIYLDLSGDSLHRRGYREEGARAPLKENLAAALLWLADWPRIAKAGGAFLDPMCGSGTLPIEAALMASDTAPGLFRTYWGFLGWKQHDAALWTKLVEQARSAVRREGLPPIWGSDEDVRVLRAARTNLDQAGLRDLVRIEHRSLKDVVPPEGLSGTPRGLFMVNPPYGERLGERNSWAPLYTELGNVLRDRFEHWQAGLFTGNKELVENVGLKPQSTHALFNGPIECQLYVYPILPKLNRSAPVQAGPAGLKWGAAQRAEAFGNRLKKNLRHLRKWAKRENVTCFRAYDKDLPEYAVAVDLYEGWVHVQEYAPPSTVEPQKARNRLLDLLATLPEICEVPPERIALKTRERQKGHAQYEKQASTGTMHEVHEGGHTFLVNLTDYLDTGLFLDHRMTRALLGTLSRGKRFLNLFCYTATATVYAAKGGATRSTSVDMSNTYLDWARLNFERNGLGSEHRLVRGDVTAWLASPQPEYDLIFLDPPTYSRSKRMEDDFDVQRDHVSLLQQTSKWLAKGGTLVFSNNFRRFKLDEVAMPELSFEEITAQTIPEDFSRNQRIHRVWKIRRK
jgi:23S rRNA (guanine2445-N2)-methyltransferase / 23S rRNA (guanine2069-N7)-methyltransferase